MSDFRSVCRKQIELVIIIPHKHSIKKGYAMNFVNESKITVIRIIP